MQQQSGLSKSEQAEYLVTQSKTEDGDSVNTDFPPRLFPHITYSVCYTSYIYLLTCGHSHRDTVALF